MKDMPADGHFYQDCILRCRLTVLVQLWVLLDFIRFWKLLWLNVSLVFLLFLLFYFVLSNFNWNKISIFHIFLCILELFQTNHTIILQRPANIGIKKPILYFWTNHPIIQFTGIAYFATHMRSTLDHSNASYNQSHTTHNRSD